MIVRGRADRTRKSYLAAVAGLARFYRRSPDQISHGEVQAYLLHMIKERKLSYSTCNIAVNAFRFVYLTTLGRDGAEFDIPHIKQPQRLPEIFSREEIARLLAAATNPKHHGLLATTYAAGLRVSEVVKLKPADIDATRMTIRVDQAKGAKDRYSLLSPLLLEELRGYWKQFRPKVWLFETRSGKHLDVSGAQKIYMAAKLRAGITKRGGIHALRHAFATHLLEAGEDLHLLFAAASDTLLTFGRDPKHLGGSVGITAVLHTWGRNLCQHIHLHCIVTGGALAADGSRFIRSRRKFLFPVRALSVVFRAKYLEAFQQAFHAGLARLSQTPMSPPRRASPRS